MVIADFIPHTRLGDVCEYTLGTTSCAPPIYVNLDTEAEGESGRESVKKGGVGMGRWATPMVMFSACAGDFAPSHEEFLTFMPDRFCIFSFLCVATVPNPVCCVTPYLFLLPVASFGSTHCVYDGTATAIVVVRRVRLREK